MKVVDLTSSDQDPDLLRAAYESVLRPSFTPDELSGPAAIVPSSEHVVSVALGSHGEPLGVAVTQLDPGGVSLLGYLAVGPAARGLGVPQECSAPGLRRTSEAPRASAPGTHRDGLSWPGWLKPTPSRSCRWSAGERSSG